jgi:hypothetical protein
MDHTDLRGMDDPELGDPMFCLLQRI